MSKLPLLDCRPVCGGTGVFALRLIKPGRRLLEFTGPFLDRAALDKALEHATVDSYLQVSADRYLGPSGGMDDFINHSCNPNCGLQFIDARILLVSIRTIRRGEEITFDYASTQNDYPCRFSCRCGSPACRGEIGDFDELPFELQLKYHELGVLAPYLASTLPRQRRRAQKMISKPSVEDHLFSG